MFYTEICTLIPMYLLVIYVSKDTSDELLACFKDTIYLVTYDPNRGSGYFEIKVFKSKYF